MSQDCPYLYMLPLPITGGGRHFFAGVVSVSADANLQPVERPQFLWCKPPERVLPSPSYLFAQSLDPFRYAHGMKERDFFGAVHDLVQGMTVLTWDAELFSLMDLRALQVFSAPAIARDAAGICSIRTALYTAALLGTLKDLPERSLDRSTARYRLQDKTQRKSPERRLTELSRIAMMLNSTHRALLAYELRPAAARTALMEQAIERNQLLCAVTNSGKTALIRPLERRDGGFAALAQMPGDEPLPVTIAANGGDNVAPLGVLTQERCRKLGIDLAYETQSLMQASVPADPNAFPRSAAETFRNSFAGSDREYLEKALELKRLPEPDEACTPHLMEYFYLYLGDEERGRLGPAQYKQYEHLTRKSLEKSIGAYVTETNNLVNYADENDPDDAALIAQITRYPMTL